MSYSEKEASNILHITSGDVAGGKLEKSGISGQVFVWHDILYDGPRRNPGWPDDGTLKARALFLEQTTAGGLDRDRVLEILHSQYQMIETAGNYDRVVLWFDACLFDQSMLAHILVCLDHKKIHDIELLCVDAFPGIDPFHGLGQLQSEQLASLFGNQQPVTNDQFAFAVLVDRAFADQDEILLKDLTKKTRAPLAWVPAAVNRWLQEKPDPTTGLGLLETLALDAIRSGCRTPGKIFSAVAAADAPPQYWGDITLWAKINALAESVPPKVLIKGPSDRLPQWESKVSLEDFRITPV